MKHYRYDLIGAHYDGVTEHPQVQMKKLGYEVIKSEPVPIADCWWFRVENKIKNTPSYLYEMKHEFKFSDER
jgi:hypothetical protein